MSARNICIRDYIRVLMPRVDADVLRKVLLCYRYFGGGGAGSRNRTVRIGNIVQEVSAALVQGTFYHSMTSGKYFAMRPW